MQAVQITNTEFTAEDLRKFAKNTNNLSKLRLHIIADILDGMPRKHVKAKYNVAYKTIQNYVEKYDENSIIGLCSPVSPSLYLDDYEMKEVKDYIARHDNIDPDDLRKYIRNKLGKHRSISKIKSFLNSQ